MNILIINSGSSSVKYQLIETNTETVIAKGLAERIGIEGSNLKHQPKAKDNISIVRPLKDHTEAIALILECLTDPSHGVLADLSGIHAVGHRVVHAGESFSGSVLINDDVLQALRDNISLAPLHNPANIMGIEACQANMPNVPMVGVFDTAFHQTMPPHAFMYAIPYDYYKRLKVRRYGFHGTSHKYVGQRMAQIMGKPMENLKIITCHLGNGGSIAAIKEGKSIDTSMGMTPLEGVMMGTRSGDMDAAIIEYIMEHDQVSIDDVMNTLNKKSGLQGVSCTSSDMRDITGAAAAGNAQAQLALEMFTYRIRKYIGAYAAVMGGVDAIVFTAGIGENVAIVRSMVMKDFEWLGIHLDEEENKVRADEHRISTPDSRVEVWVVATNEELAIAREALAFVK